MSVSKAGLKALRIASLRPLGNVCPVYGVHSAAQTALLRKLHKDYLISDEACPVITDLGRHLLRTRDFLGLDGSL